MSAEEDELARILERERRQMEQIRELDMEELQVEEVEDEDEDEEGPSSLRNSHDNGGVTFNTSLASLHTYLGDVNDTHGRLTILDGGAILKLPMFYLEGVVLFPEATLPLRVIQSRYIAAVEKALNQVDVPYMIGVVHVHRDVDSGNLCFASVGTTAEIRQYRRLEDGSWNVVTRGQQRFRLRRHWIDFAGVPCGEVQIVQEDQPLKTPRDAFAQFASVNSCRSGMPEFCSPDDYSAKHCHGALSEQPCGITSPASVESDMSASDSSMHISSSPNKYDMVSDDDNMVIHEEAWMREKDAMKSSESCHTVRFDNLEYQDSSDIEIVNSSTPSVKWAKSRSKKIGKLFKKSKQTIQAPLSFWPHWTYEMYDSYSLARRAADLWRQVITKPNMDDFVRKPDLLSFCIASKIPVSESTRQELLEIDGVSYRLQSEIKLLKAFNLIRCKSCLTLFAKRSDMVVMSLGGPLNAYVNPYGCVHEIITVHNANGLALVGVPSEEHSWFPGYAWTTAICASCETFMGWLFTATRKNLLPKSFWGIRSSQVSDDTKSTQA